MWTGSSPIFILNLSNKRQWIYAVEDKDGRGQDTTEMAKPTEFDEPSQDRAETRFYLPAVTASRDIDRLGNVLDELFEFHGVVLIPDTYNE